MKFKILIIGLLFSITTAFSQAEYKVYSALMYHVMKNTQWPSGKATSSIVVGVFGSSTMTTNMKALAASKTINGKKIIVKEIGSSGDAAKCNVVFLSRTKNNQLSSLSSTAKSNAILLVTEVSGAAKKGAVINLSLASGKPVIELNESRASLNKLRITSELKKLAKLVN